MDRTDTSVAFAATSDEMMVALNAALEAGDLNIIMGLLGHMTRDHRLKRVAQETGLGEKSLYKSMRAGASPKFNTVLRVLRSLGFTLQIKPINGGDNQ